MVTIFLGVLAIAWICVGGQVLMQRRQEGRADSTVSSFRAQLSTLERATPGTMMRQSLTGPVPMVKVESAPPRSTMSPVQRRRRDVLLALTGAFLLSLLSAVIVGGGLAVFATLVTGSALGAYIWALRQIRARAISRTMRVGAPRIGDLSAEAAADTGASVTVLAHPQAVGGSTILPRTLAN